jgi:ribosomal protein S12 methylthiotransferase accessory factor
VVSEPTRNDESERRLRLADGLDIVDIPDGLVLRTSTTTLKLEGGVGRLMRDRLLPALNAAPTRRSLLAGVGDLPQAEVERLLDRLMQSGLVLESSINGHEAPPAWTQLIAVDLEQRQSVAARAAAMTVTILGGGPLSDLLGVTLTASGVGTVVLATPVFAAEGPLPAKRSGGPGEPHVQRCTAAVTREAVRTLVAGSDLVITAVDPNMAAARVRVNEASISEGVPSIHVAINGSQATIGPLVLPGEGPCYLCWRMRAIACEQDFAVAMAIEETLDAAGGSASAYPVLPTIIPSVAAVLAREVLALTVGVIPARLPARVLELDGIEGRERLHVVLPRPDCPVCQKKDHRPHAAPPLGELLAADEATTDFDRIARDAVSPLCGVIRVLERIPKDLAEPEAPIIVRAELANSQFLQGEHGFTGCSGKGLGITAARNGALGEAIERYAALNWIPQRRFVGIRAAVPGRTLHPAELVLYAPEQYARLPFASYADDTVLEWVPARSLRDGDEVWVPLLAAHLGYQVPDASAYLFPSTSNGFAGGPTLTYAALRALLEVIERDAFLISWSHRLPGTRYDARTVADDETQSIALAYARRGVHIDVHLLPTDTAATAALAIGWNDQLPSAVVGLGADLDPVSAARRAVLEVAQVRPALRARLQRRDVVERMRSLAGDPSTVRDLDDHDLLYADPATALRALAFLRDCPRQMWDLLPAPARSTSQALSELVSSVIDIAGDVLYLDVTPRDAASLGVAVARVIVPGFQPIHFGAAQMRLGHQRLRRMPSDIGLRARPAELDELNLDPHPVA